MRCGGRRSGGGGWVEDGAVGMDDSRESLTRRSGVMIAAAISEIEEPKRFDLIVTNPPFHDEYQTDISVSLDLFLQATERLSASGYLVVVANRHLNYLTHLRRYFDEVTTVAENEKFIVYRSR